MSLSKRSNQNQEITLATYEAGVDDYIKNTNNEISGDLKSYLDNILSIIPSEAEILEVGSASGRDADYIESRGFSIQRSDAVAGFVRYMNRDVNRALLFNVLTDDLGKTFDVVLATASLLHFSQEQFELALRTIHRHVKPGGMVIVALKPGQGEESSTRKMNAPRYFKYWEADELKKIISTNGYVVKKCALISADKWIECIAIKS